MARFCNLIYVVCFGYSVAFLEPCKFYPHRLPNGNGTDIFTPSPTCTKGIIDWSYPRGTLTIQFDQHSQFQLCIKDWIGGNAFTILDNSFDKLTPLKTLTDENQCINSHGHRAILIVKAPSLLVYMGGFEYEIVAKDR